MLRPGADGPAEAGNERQNAGVEENVQLEKKGKGFSTREAFQERMLFRRYNAALLPLLQSGEYGHEVFVLRMWGDASGAGHAFRARRSMNLPIVHCNRLARAENTVIKTLGWCAGNNHRRPSTLF